MLFLFIPAFKDMAIGFFEKDPLAYVSTAYSDFLYGVHLDKGKTKDLENYCANMKSSPRIFKKYKNRKFECLQDENVFFYQKYMRSIKLAKIPNVLGTSFF